MKKRIFKFNTHTKDIQLPNEKIIKIIEDSYYKKLMEQANNTDVTINHLENIFSNEIYYSAMKIVPLLERKVLYLSYIENVKLNDICRRLKLQKKEVIKLRNKGIHHFKYNLKILNKANNLKKDFKWTTTDERILNKSKNTNSIRVLYKKIGQLPKVQIINNVFTLKKAIIKNNLDIIPYENLYIICNNKNLMKFMKPNIVLTFKSIKGVFILVDIDKNTREFKSLSQEDIIWFSQDLINKSVLIGDKKWII